MFKKLFGKKDKLQSSQQTLNGTSPQEAALMNAIKEKKKEDPLIGLKLGSKEITQWLMNALKDEKGVHLESMLAILGSLGGYSCHVAVREELINTGRVGEKEVFTILGSADGKNYYIGEIVNKPLVEDNLSIWGLAAGIVQHLGTPELPDINEIFAHVSSTIGSEDFGIPQIPEAHKPGDLPLNYVKGLWGHIVPIIDKFCEQPIEKPILLGLAIQEIIAMGKNVVTPNIALKIVMECAVPMSKIGPEWIVEHA